MTVYRVTYESAFRDTGFNVRSMENAGAGGERRTIEAVGRVFPQIWFNATTDRRSDALGWYHAKTERGRASTQGLTTTGQSHAADAFGRMAMDYRRVPTLERFRTLKYKRLR